MDILFSLATILLAGLLFGKLVKIFKQPDVIGYLIAGILIGPCVLKLISFEQISNLDTFGIIALSFISFLIGSEFKIRYIKKLGISPFIIAICSSFITLVTVTIVLYMVGCSLPFSLLLGAIASATAPAVTMVVIKQFKAKGDLTNTILSVIAIDDIISIIVFGFCLVIAKNLMTNTVSLIALVQPFIEIVASILIGGILGLILGMIVKHIKRDGDITTIIIAFVFTTIVLTNYYNMSPLLVCMIMGGVFVNSFQHRTTGKVLNLIDYVTPPIFMIFFVISGASLDFNMLPAVASVCAFYILARSFGKIFGAFIGAKIVKDQPKIVKYLGPTLLSQTGLAIGLAIVASNTLNDSENHIQTIIIASSLVFDLFVPIITKSMLKKAKEIKEF